MWLSATKTGAACYRESQCKQCGGAVVDFVKHEQLATKECMEWDGLERCYYVYKSPTLVREGPDVYKVPMVVDIHGVASCAEYSSFYTGWKELAEGGAQFVLVWPQGAEKLNMTGAAAVSADQLRFSRQPSWNAGDGPEGCCGDAKAAGVDDVGFLSKTFLSPAETRNLSSSANLKPRSSDVR